MKNLKRILSGLLCAAVLVASTKPVSAEEAAYSIDASDLSAATNTSLGAMIDESTIDAYLFSAGFSKAFIEFNDYNTKHELYKDRAVFASDEVTYGIMTDTYNVLYTLNNDGSVNMLPQERKEFDALLADAAAVKGILRYGAKNG